MKYFSLLILCGSLLFTANRFTEETEIKPNSTENIKEREIQAPSNCPASPLPTRIVQTDGTSITLMGKGNMTNSWTETTDGYTIIPVNGIYQYAKKVNGDLQPTGVKANDPANRSSNELSYVSSIQKNIKPNLDPLKTSVLNRVNAQLSNKTFPATGSIRVLALLIDYPNLQNTFPKSNFDSLLYASNYRNGDGSFKTYYETSANGQLSITVDVMGWYRAANNYTYYSRDSGYSRAADLVREAVDAAETAGVNFANYDNDSDGSVDGILAVHAGPGAEQGSRTEYIWSHRWVLNGGTSGAVTYDGKFINDYMINPETRVSGLNQNMVGIGVFVHEFGHNLGLPDLYDTDNTNGGSEGIGNWCLMAGGGWMGGEHRPINFSAWCRIENNWDTPVQKVIGSSSSDTLKPSSLNQNEIYQVNTGVTSEYFLLENRQKVGLDLELPGEGLAVWHINTTKTNSSGNGVNADENLKGVDLEEADGNNDLDNEINRGDAGDLFPGSSNASSFDDNSNPNARNYSLAASGLLLRNITETGSLVSFDFGPPSAPLTCSGGPTTLTASAGSFSDGSGTSNYSNNSSCSWLIQPTGVSSITLGFTNLATELNADVIRLYDGLNNSAPLLASYSGTNNTNTTTSTGGVMFVEFTTNGSVVDAGWDAVYTSSIAGPGCTGSTTLSTLSGNFSDGSGANNYDNNQSCSWLIQPGAGIITLNFTSFATQSGADQVIVYDGPNNSATQIGNFSGSSIPASLVSTGNSLYIEFTSDGSIVDAGWDANYSANPITSTCSGTTNLTALSGTFDDGSGANQNYSDGLNCSWLINVSSASIVELTFDSLDLVSGDSLFVYDGSNTSAALIGVYTGTAIPASVISTNNSAFVVFKTDASNTGEGWQISYEGINGCSGLKNLTAVAGTFSDGTQQNQPYINSNTCQWLIQPAGANFISLDFNRFATESGFDFVEIFDGPNNSSASLGRYSGSAIPPSITSSGGSLFVEFTTDFSVTALGWEARYSSTTSSCLPNRLLSNNTGSISDGSGTSNYDNNTNCTWLIQPPLATNITLTFSAFDIEATNDLVNIYDGADNTGTLIGSYSGNSLPPVATINGTNKSMFIEFISDGSNTAPGWDASYSSTSAITCSGVTTFTASSGAFEDGSGPSIYDNNLNCGWLIQPTGNPASIVLNMTAMDLANFGDRVRVYDGTSNAGTPIGFFNGTNTGNPVTAFSGSMFVEFISDGSIQGQGFSAIYSSSSTFCAPNSTFTNTFGNFTDGSPLTSNYLNNTDCQWLIQPAAANVAVRLTFFQFNTELGNDTVTVYNGTSITDPVLGTFSGNLGTLPSITSSGGSMLVTFKTNGSTTSSGWRASYNTQQIPACVGLTNLTASSGTFDDGSAATANYIENSNCQWLIQPPGANIISLSFTRFSTQSTFDFVRVYEGSNSSAPLIGSYSGSAIPPTINTNGGSLFLEFISNGFSNSTGWEATYNSSSSQCFSNLSITAFSDTLEDGSGSLNYQSNLNCSWLIQPSTATSINLSFLNFDLDNMGDTLKVYDGNSSSAPLLGAYTGSALPTAVSSTGGSMYLEFITDGSVSAQGWRAVYDITSSLSCIGTTNLTAASGSFSDGSGTGLYDNNLNCSWRIQPPGNPTVIVLTMNNLALANFGDLVRVYDGVDNTGNILATFFGTNTRNPVSAFSGSMFVEFTSDGNTQGQGWDASYTSSNTYCAPNTTFTNNFGSFTDGSPIGTNYLNNTNCEWLIQPAAPNVAVRLTLFQFNTEASFDSVSVYDGANASAPLLGTYSGTLGTLPAVVSSGGSMFVTFVSNGSTTSSGWRASYGTQAIPFCSGTTTLTASSGTFDDGSGQGTNYIQNSTCRWLIQPSAGALTIDLNFNYFATQAGFDFVNIYDGTTSAAPSLGTFSGTNLPSTVQATSGSMFVEFTSNGGIQLNGWEATYTSSSTFNLTASPDTVFINAGLGSTGSFSVSSNTSWRTSDNANWLIASPFNGAQNQTVNLLATQPNIGPQRFAEVYVTGTVNPISDTVIVVQSASGNFLVASPDTLFFTDNPNSSQNALISSSVSWILSPSDTWLTVSPSAGINNGTGAVSLQQNNSTTSRTAFIVASGNLGVTNDTVFVKQAGRIPQPPSLSVNPKNITLAETAGSSDIFTVNSTIVWQTSSPASWLNIINPSNMFDTNTVMISAITANPSTSARTTYVAIQDLGGTLFDTVFVSQNGATPVPPSLSLSPKNIVLNQAINSLDTFLVNSNVNWMLNTPASWLNVNPPANQTDTGKVEIVANSANNNAQTRNTFVAVQDMAGSLFDTVFVSQIGTAPTLLTNPDTIFFASSGGLIDSVILTSNVAWSMGNPLAWIAVSSTNGSGSATIRVTSTANNTGARRTGFITFSDNQTGALVDTVFIVQEFNIVGPPTADVDTIRLASNVGSQKSFNVLAGISTSWTSFVNDPWISLSPNSGTGSSPVVVTANSSNPSTVERMTFIVISDLSLPIPDTVFVIQEGKVPSLAVSPAAISLNFNSGSNASVQVQSNVSWTVNNPVSWLSLSQSSGTGNAAVSLTANSDNLTGANRIATLSFDSPGLTSELVVVTQVDGSTPNFNLSVDTIYLSNPQGSTNQFAVQSNQPSWTLSENTPWLLVNPLSGSNTENITILAASRNTFGNPRTAIIRSSITGFPDDSVVVIQEGATALFQVAPSQLILGGDSADQVSFNISSNLINWTITENSPWMEVSTNAGSFTQRITITAIDSNNTGNVRRDTLTVSAPPLVPQKVAVMQDTAMVIGIASFRSLANFSLYPNPNAGNFKLEIGQGADLNKANIEIYNLLGKRVNFNRTVLSPSLIEINLNEQVPGIYFLSIQIGSERISQKITVLDR